MGAISFRLRQASFTDLLRLVSSCSHSKWPHFLIRHPAHSSSSFMAHTAKPAKSSTKSKGPKATRRDKAAGTRQDFCRYPSKYCGNKRALKSNGTLHRFCELHRRRANLNQQRWSRARRPNAESGLAIEENHHFEEQSAEWMPNMVEPSLAAPFQYPYHESWNEAHALDDFVQWMADAPLPLMPEKTEGHFASQEDGFPAPLVGSSFGSPRIISSFIV